MRILISAGALALISCTTVPPEEEKPVPVQGAGTCNAVAVQDLVGRQRSDALGADAMRRSGARTVRWIGQDTVYTQDFREDRINIDVDASGRVTRLRCF